MTPTGSAGFGRDLRLRKSPEFERVQRGGTRFHGRLLVVIRAENGRSGPRFGLAVSRKVGNAVVRNRVKRWLREAIRLGATGIGAHDIVVIARPAAADAGLPAIASELALALRPLIPTAGVR